MNMKILKGQYFSFDAIIGSVIFVMALVSLLSYWSSLRSSLDFQNNDVSREAVRISNTLLLQGNPSDVSCENMDRLGFANQNRRINWSTVLCAQLKLNTQNVLKDKLETGYNVIIVFESPSSSRSVSIGGAVNQNFLDTANNIYKLRRIVSIDSPEDELVYLDVYLYR